MTLLSRVSFSAKLVQLEKLGVNWEKEKKTGAGEWL